MEVLRDHDEDDENPDEQQDLRNLGGSVLIRALAVLRYDQRENPGDVASDEDAASVTQRTKETGSERALVYEPVPGAVRNLGAVQTMAQAGKLARVHDPTVLRFEPHPLLDAYATIWTPRAPLRPRAVPSRTGEVARKEIASRECQSIAHNPRLAYSLPDADSWRRSRPHVPHHVVLWWRSSPLATATCCMGVPRWLHSGEETAFREEVFSFRLRQTPAVAWSFIGHIGVPTELVLQVHAVVARVWQQQVLGCFRQIWRWRHSTTDDSVPWTLAVASSALRGALRAAFHQVSSTLQQAPEFLEPLQRMLHGLQRQQLEAEPEVKRGVRSVTDQFLLFFDGGSRGNPGPGGAGAVIVRVDAMSLASNTTTNNQAEYVGVVTGQRYATAKRLQPLTVIGDSAMIINQLRDHRAPKNDALRILYGQARTMADVHRVTQWSHHVRAFNKMADCAANLAMDSKRSVQSRQQTRETLLQRVVVVSCHLTRIFEFRQPAVLPLSQMNGQLHQSDASLILRHCVRLGEHQQDPRLRPRPANSP